MPKAHTVYKSVYKAYIKKHEYFFPKLFSDFQFWTFLKMSIFNFLKKLLKKLCKKWVVTIMLLKSKICFKKCD